MKELLFATQNLHKLEEINQLITQFEIKSAFDYGITEDIPETGATLADNALQKARYVFEKTNKNCFADDTGLEIDALNGEPGVYSARYAGPERDATKNMALVLEKLGDRNNRTARFKTVIALIYQGKEYLFEGAVEGEITETLSGKAGFGYDPIFKPRGEKKTFAEMTAEEKNSMSHRARAVKELVGFLGMI